MTTVKYGIPDLDLTCRLGTKINPSNFAGHDLVALFLPTDAGQAARELSAYRLHYRDFANFDAWVLAFMEEPFTAVRRRAGEPVMIDDRDRRAWVAFRDLAVSPETLDCAEGATFLFPRSGGLHRVWPGSGHVGEVVTELQTPASEHEHQMHGSAQAAAP